MDINLDKRTGIGRAYITHGRMVACVAIITIQVAVISLICVNGGVKMAATALTNQDRRPVMRYDDWAAITQRDPKCGAQLPPIAYVDDMGNKGTIGSDANITGVLFISSCTGCASKELAVWNQMQVQHPKASLFVLQADNDLDAIREFKQRYHATIPFIVEDTDVLTKACNAYFMPRIVLLDAQSRFTYVQPSTSSIQQTLQIIKNAGLLDTRESRSAGHVKRL